MTINSNIMLGWNYANAQLEAVAAIKRIGNPRAMDKDDKRMALVEALRDAFKLGYIARSVAKAKSIAAGDDDAISACVEKAKAIRAAAKPGSTPKDGQRVRTAVEHSLAKAADVTWQRVVDKAYPAEKAKPEPRPAQAATAGGDDGETHSELVKAGDIASPAAPAAVDAEAFCRHIENQAASLLGYVNKNAKVPHVPMAYKEAVAAFHRAIKAAHIEADMETAKAKA